MRGEIGTGKIEKYAEEEKSGFFLPLWAKLRLWLVIGPINEAQPLKFNDTLNSFRFRLYFRSEVLLSPGVDMEAENC